MIWFEHCANAKDSELRDWGIPGMAAPRLRHLFLHNSESTYSYTARGGGGGEFLRPPRDRARHAQKLTNDLQQAETDAIGRGFAKADDRILTYELQPNALEVVDSLERQQSGTQLLAVTVNSAAIRATVRVPASKMRLLHGILERYATKLDKRSNRPVSQDLVESVNTIRLATESDLWTDSSPFPAQDCPVWWEIWLSHGKLVGKCSAALPLRKVDGSPLEPGEYCLVVQGFAHEGKLHGSSRCAVEIVTGEHRFQITDCRSHWLRDVCRLP